MVLIKPVNKMSATRLFYTKSETQNTEHKPLEVLQRNFRRIATERSIEFCTASNI